uniref:CSON007182 protein n=1 Tax=Culicoides sonorensis TaxID=179676 RepID=A0A336LAB7_CULSO
MTYQFKFTIFLKILISLTIIFNQSIARRTFFIENFEAEDFEGRSIVTFNYTKKDGTYLINGLIHVLKPIQNYMVQVESTSIPNIGPRITFINRTVNACKMFKKKNQNDFLFKFFVTTIKKYSNVSLSCPVKALTYSINKFQLDMDQLPSFIPVIDQQIHFYARSFNLNTDGSEENYLIVKNKWLLINSYIVNGLGNLFGIIDITQKTKKINLLHEKRTNVGIICSSCHKNLVLYLVECRVITRRLLNELFLTASHYGKCDSSRFESCYKISYKTEISLKLKSRLT